MLENPFFGAIVTTLDIQTDSEIQTYTSNHNQILFNPNYLQESSLIDIEFVLLNFAMHSLLRHNARSGKRHKNLWNKATDYTINSLLNKNGISIPLEANYSDEFDGMYSEEVYEILKSQSDADELESDEIIEIQPEKYLLDEESIGEEFYEQLISKVANQGRLPKDIQKHLPSLFSQKIDWQERLYRYISPYHKSLFEFMPPNMKHLYRGIYLPSLRSNLLSIIVAIDTSGSVDDKLAQRFLGELESIMLQFDNYEIDLIMADSKIQSHTVFQAGERLDCEIVGRGGTDFGVVFEYIEQMIDNPTLLIYFTDGKGKFPTTQPQYDVLWVTNDTINVPFGDTIVLS